MLDNRRSGRERCYLGGRISYNNDLWGEDCIVRNVSKRGARLRVADPRTLPDRFSFRIPKREVACTAQVRWRENDQIGIVFEIDTPAEVIDFSAFRARHIGLLRTRRK